MRIMNVFFFKAAILSRHKSWMNAGLSLVYDVGQTLNQHWVNVLCLLGTQSSQQDLRLIYISHSFRNMSLSQRHFNTENAEIYLYKTWRQKGYFQFEIIMNVLVSSFRFIWIPMLWVYDH